MPVAQFAGNRGWGYDGVLQYAPHNAYGGPEKLKSLIDAAHARNMMVLLDVVYNHFGPDGNYLGLYAPEFFHPERQTPWGAAIAYEKPPVRRFFIENALYWLCEYRFDGLRLDAIDQIDDQAETPILEELAAEVRRTIPERQIHLTTEDDRNIVRLHGRDFYGRPRLYAGEWNDDFHHAAHVVATGEREGYYADYSDDAADLARSLAEGYVYQGSVALSRRRQAGRAVRIAAADCVRRLPAEPRPDRQSRVRRAADDARRRGDAGAAYRGSAAGTAHAAAVHGRGVGRAAPLLLLYRLHRRAGDAVREGRRAEFKKWPQFADPGQPREDTRSECAADRGRFSPRLECRKAEKAPRAWRSFASCSTFAHGRSLPRLAGTKGGEAGYEMFGRARSP